MELPYGYDIKNDRDLINHLIKDNIFIDSIESELGPISQLYADWANDKIVFILKSGRNKESSITGIIAFLKKINYQKEISQ